MPNWITKPPSAKVRRAQLEAELARCMSALASLDRQDAERAARIAQATPELQDALTNLQAAQERLARAQAAMGEDANGFGSLGRRSRLQDQLADAQAELEELQP